MRPINFRNETFASIQDRIAGQRAAVLHAWQHHGPGTTAEIAERSGISVLNVRPRTNELYHDLGFLTLADDLPGGWPGQTPGGEHAATVRGATYRVRTVPEHLAWFSAQRRDATTPQRELSFG